jgi:hypothetical protein
MDLHTAPDDNGQSRKSEQGSTMFAPDLRTRITAYCLFGGLSLITLLLGFWTFVHVAASRNGYVQPGLLFTLSVSVLLVGVHGLSVRVALTESNIDYHSLFGTTRIPIADVVSIVPISARGFRGIKISTSSLDLVIHGYSMSANSLSKFTATLTERAHQAISTGARRQSSLPKETVWETAVVYSPFVIIWGGALIAFIIYRSRHSY